MVRRKIVVFVLSGQLDISTRREEQLKLKILVIPMKGLTIGQISASHTRNARFSH